MTSPTALRGDMRPGSHLRERDGAGASAQFSNSASASGSPFKRSQLLQALIDVLAVTAAIALICVIAAAIGFAILVFSLVKFP